MGVNLSNVEHESIGYLEAAKHLKLRLKLGTM